MTDSFSTADLAALIEAAVDADSTGVKIAYDWVKVVGTIQFSPEIWAQLAPDVQAYILTNYGGLRS